MGGPGVVMKKSVFILSYRAQNEMALALSLGGVFVDSGVRLMETDIWFITLNDPTKWACYEMSNQRLREMFKEYYFTEEHPTTYSAYVNGEGVTQDVVDSIVGMFNTCVESDFAIVVDIDSPPVYLSELVDSILIERPDLASKLVLCRCDSFVNIGVPRFSSSRVEARIKQVLNLVEEA